MKHDPRLIDRAVRRAPQAHPAWCRCRMCRRRLEARLELAEIRRAALQGALLAIPLCLVIIVVDQWPAIAAAWEALNG